MSPLLYCQSSFIFFINFFFLCQSNVNVEKETEVMPLGVKGVKALMESGMDESYVSADKYADIVTLSSVISY